MSDQAAEATGLHPQEDPSTVPGEVTDAALIVAVHARGDLVTDGTRCLRLDRDDPQLNPVGIYAERVYLEAA
jgi:hypothetical protein